jgi:hypothetical protein
MTFCIRLGIAQAEVQFAVALHDPPLRFESADHMEINLRLYDTCSEPVRSLDEMQDDA